MASSLHPSWLLGVVREQEEKGRIRREESMRKESLHHSTLMTDVGYLLSWEWHQRCAVATLQKLSQNSPPLWQMQTKPQPNTKRWLSVCLLCLVLNYKQSGFELLRAILVFENLLLFMTLRKRAGEMLSVPSVVLYLCQFCLVLTPCRYSCPEVAVWLYRRGRWASAGRVWLDRGAWWTTGCTAPLQPHETDPLTAGAGHQKRPKEGRKRKGLKGQVSLDLDYKPSGNDKSTQIKLIATKRKGKNGKNKQMDKN